MDHKLPGGGTFRDYESPALTTELQPLTWFFRATNCKRPCLALVLVLVVSKPGTIRERSPGHFELRAYNAATGKQVTKTYTHRAKRRALGSQGVAAPLAMPNQ
jgi:hypothetical protein